MERFKKRSQALRLAQTGAEANLWYRLRDRRLARWKFRRQHPIGRYVVDFVTLDGRLIVEVDGATHSTPVDLRRDAERTAVLNGLGFEVLRVTNMDVYDNLDGVLQAILDLLAMGRHASPLPEGEVDGEAGG